MARTIALLSFILSLLSFPHDSLASNNLRGVSQEDQALYAGPTLTCEGGKRIISVSLVNDDYCDCADGLDEPGTSACNFKFYCNNLGHQSQYIYSSRVNDGICDCCDGSDEFTTTKECKNTCWEMGAQARAEQEEKMKAIEEGSKVRDGLIARGKQLKVERKQELETLKAERETIKQEVDRLAELEKQAQEAEDERLAKEQEQKAPEVEASIASETKPSEVQSQEDDDFDAEFDAAFGDAPAQNNIPPPPVVEEEANNNDEPAEDAPKHELTQALDQAKSVHEDAKRKISDMDNKISNLERVLNLDFGNQEEFAPMHADGTLKYITRDNKYTYEVEPFADAYQKEGGSRTLLGKWKGWKKGSQRTVMLFENGQKCWNGPNRSLHVELQCGLKNEILEVSEPERCVYHMAMKTPAACVPEKDKAGKPQRQNPSSIPPHDEL
eukprot:TRINITY_DN4356_c0_g1::TRINITY_DN4356_c0_g1_i1::g.21168::m.21168 TRINITY_DN4356_c0_g1::TRINITY_DN4356_c0_g1_i1::g.21168  ORF type:complete len:449 (+),score=84.71,sp/A2WNF5/GLU2B_ORYSI/44.51/5e-38,sp/A2WNF5/GLU2B_ORYSI/40.88/5e-28,PRKCSH-like/PF12999.2/4.5e-38,PRKCSH-like/PF12999.2/98,PRKCSH-like/PF12999.2/46,PRKCSH_1/PF13015.1/5.7e+03,PRKCSH_1/PF13015.1/6.3e-27,ATG27/PF09451.5/0.00055,Ldl_recept_a/PF00057.13/1.4,Ldl_recept_a/PF00057.13/12,DUF3584/PF12128.3/3.3,Pox_A_type_inc/PF04508.7/5.5e+02,Po